MSEELQFKFTPGDVVALNSAPALHMTVLRSWVSGRNGQDGEPAYGEKIVTIAYFSGERMHVEDFPEPCLTKADLGHTP